MKLVVENCRVVWLPKISTMIWWSISTESSTSNLWALTAEWLNHWILWNKSAITNRWLYCSQNSCGLKQWFLTAEKGNRLQLGEFYPSLLWSSIFPCFWPIIPKVLLQCPWYIKFLAQTKIEPLNTRFLLGSNQM